jgi:signal transduction histidine kinase
MTNTQQSDATVRRAEPSRLRWPIHFQLLVPMVAVVLLASFLATAITASWIALRVRTEQRESLRRAAKTLGEAPFPFTESVLRQMSGLSGAEFVLMSPQGRGQESTLAVKPAELEELARHARSRASDDAKDAVVALGDRNYLVDFVSISRRSQVAEPATLFILYPEDELTSRIHQAVYPALAAGVVAAAVAVAIATWLARRFVRPVHTLVARTAAIARGDFTPMPVGPRNDELRDLAESINRMTAQLADYEGEVRRSERLKTLGQLGAAMAHQLRNAATGGRMAIELHRRDCPAGAADESLEVALRQLRLMESYLRQFLSIEPASPAARRPVDVVQLTQDVLELVRPSFVHAGVELQFTPPAEPLVLQGDAEALGQLVTNLVLNALDAALTGPHRPPRVAVDLLRTSDGRGLLRVQDSGPGPAAAVRDQLFHALVSTKPDGFGLGLFVARQIAERHDGRLSWERNGETTCFSLEFPLQKSDRNWRTRNSLFCSPGVYAWDE